MFLQHIPTPLFVLEIWKACLVGLIESPEGTEELKWTAFTFLKVPGTWSSKAASLGMVLGKSSDTLDLCPVFLPLASHPACQIPRHKFPSIIFSESSRAIFSSLGRPLLFLSTQVLFSSVCNLIGAGQWAPVLEAGV